MPKKLIGTIHVSLMGLVYASPFIFPWKLVIGGVVLYYLQNIVFGKCLLTLWQYGPDRKIFHQRVLNKLGFKFNPKKIEFAVNYIIPLVILLLTFSIRGRN